MQLVLRKLSDLKSIEQNDLFNRFETQEPDYIDSFIKLKLKTFENNHLLHTKILIDEESNTLVGFFSLTRTTIELNKIYKRNHQVYADQGFSFYPAVDIQYFAVNKAYQQRGLGRILMNVALSNIIDVVHQYVGASVVTLTSLDSAIGFYTKLGFNEQGHHGGMTDDHRMLMTIPEVETLLKIGDN